MALAARIIAPRPIRTPSEWGAASREYGQTSGHPGPRNPWITPWLARWADETASGRWLSTTAITASQTGKPECLLDLIGQMADEQPGPIIYVAPSQDFIRDQFEPRLQAMLDEVPSLAAKAKRGHQPKFKKTVGGVPIRLAHAGSSTALKSDPAARGRERARSRAVTPPTSDDRIRPLRRTP